MESLPDLWGSSQRFKIKKNSQSTAPADARRALEGLTNDFGQPCVRQWASARRSVVAFPSLRRPHQLRRACSILCILGELKGLKSFSSPQDDPKAARCLLLRQDRCLLLRQDRCLLLRHDRCLLLRQGAAPPCLNTTHLSCLNLY